MQSKKKYIIIYIFLISFFILLITSKNSPFYALNDWTDANAFFTLGKGMMNGLIPYKDLFEQKGPFLYLIYGIGYLISHKTFFGVFIMETLIFTLGLYYLYKILKMFISTKSALLIIPLFTFLFTTCRAFTHGGSAEEFSLACFFITLYYFFKHFKIQELSFREMLLNGFIAGLVLLIKYTLLGFWIGFTFAIFIDYLLKKDYKKAITYPLILLLGMFIPFILFSIYFLINHGFISFIKNYFFINMTMYAEKKYSLPMQIYKIFYSFFHTLHTNPIQFYLLLSTPLLIIPLKINKRFKILYMISIIFSILGIFCGLKYFRYYVLFIILFTSISLLLIFNIIDKYIIKTSNITYISLITFTILLSLYCSFNLANYKDSLFLSKDNYFQYEYAEILNNYPNSSLLNMGFLDCGLFTTSGKLPITFFYQKHNFNYHIFPDNIDALNNSIKNKETTHIIYLSKYNENKLRLKEPILFNNYNLIKVREQNYEGRIYKAYLFEIKNN